MKSVRKRSNVFSVFTLFAGVLVLNSCTPRAQSPSVGVFELPEGYQIEKVADGLNFPSSVTFDDQGQLYVVESGGGLTPMQARPMRILRVEGDQTTEVVNLDGLGIGAPVTGMTWYEGAFYITHRHGENRTGTVSRVTPGGQITEVLSGIIDSQSEHHVNGLEVGPDGLMYLGVGEAANAAVVGSDIAPFVELSPELQARPCQDITLRGHNFQAEDFRTDVEGDMVLTGAFVPFGTPTEPGQVIEGVTKCGSSILKFDPSDAEGTLAVHAWGFRQPIDVAFDPQTGELYVAENGYDNRGPRPVNDEFDATLRVEAGTWYGVPDFSAAREPLSDPKFEAPDDLQATVFEGTETELGKELDFVIDHEASGLTPPDPSLVIGLHPFNSSPSGLDVAPESWGEFAGDVFVSEWGDLAPATNPIRGQAPAGFRVVQIDPDSGQLEPFVGNAAPGPASKQNAAGNGLERPFDVKFGPDGALYISDYGVVNVNPEQMPPYQQMPGTGAVWKVTRAGR